MTEKDKFVMCVVVIKHRTSCVCVCVCVCDREIDEGERFEDVFLLLCEFSNWVEDRVTNTTGIVSLIEL